MNKAEIRKVKTAIALLEVVLQDLNKTSNEQLLQGLRRDTLYHIFYDGNRLDELFLAIIPIKEIEQISRVLLIARTAYGATGGEQGGIQSHYGAVSVIELRKTMEKLLSYLKRTLLKYGFNIFYSWQADNSSTLNRNFIQSSLEKAIKSASDRLLLPLQLDKDTINREGAPDIVQTILAKIDECIIFVSDISITSEHLTDNSIRRYSPNANVLYELGYAQGVLGESNIIMIFNEATGSIENLPFDLRGRRIMKYNLSTETSAEDKKKIKQDLSRHLENAIIGILNTDIL